MPHHNPFPPPRHAGQGEAHDGNSDAVERTFTGSVANTHGQIFDVPTVFVCALCIELDDAGPAVGAAVEVFG